MIRSMRPLAVIAIAFAIIASASAQPRPNGTASPATNILEQQRYIDEQLADARGTAAPLDALVDWQWGGWIEHYTFHFDDGVQASRWYHRPGMSLWTRLRFDGGTHELFARMKLGFEYFKPGDEYERQQDWVGPNLERLWYQVDVGRALRITTPADPYQLTLRIGRQQAMIGSGYVLDTPLDAVYFDSRLHDLRVQGLLGKTFGLTPNIDRSDPVDNNSARCFYGVQLSYTGIERHEPYVYALWNDDHTDERPQDWFQNYSYDTAYFGIGSQGELVHNLRYWAEGVFETGKSWGNDQWIVRDDVNAWGWSAGLEYLFDTPTRPRLAFEYMFASGDRDRIGSPSNAAGGNRRGMDTSFNAFGYRDTGISASPALSNMHVWRLGGSCAPFAKYESFRDLELGTNWFLYHKHHARAAISDITSDMNAGYVGWEMDYFANWRISSDLSWTLRWGAFFPGDAYNDRGMRNFVFTGITWSF